MLDIKKLCASSLFLFGAWLLLSGLPNSGGLEGNRLPLQRSNIEIKLKGPVGPELMGTRDRKPVYYDPQPRIDPLGDGKYALSWQGSHGRRLTIFYQRPDFIDVVVGVSAFKDSSGRYEYKYRVQSLKSSKENLAAFILQTFSLTAQGIPQPGIAIGNMNNTNLYEEFKEGRWIVFSIMADQRRVDPGQEITFVLNSPDPPGLVQCRAEGGTLGLKGVGEEMPEVLENAISIPRGKIWPYGLTIGPDSRLSKLSRGERFALFAPYVPEMGRIGWIRDHNTMIWYQRHLSAQKVLEVELRAKNDFNQKIISSELLALLTS